MNTEFQKFIKKHFRTTRNFKRVVRVSEPTARMFLKDPLKMRISDFVEISLYTGLSREDVWKAVNNSINLNTTKDEGVE